METSTVNIKKEPPNSSDEMKEFAETAMNELLGWYGYDADPDDDDDTDVRRYSRSGDSSGPEYSDSGGTGSGGPWCGWCNKPMTADVQTTGAFCSELCFSQSRRASFKRNRTCDWCRHVRHSVAHVDVRDGARHLQFCSDKCLNQYKMHIFCRETRAHLQLHPHADLPATDATLITPDLWLKDCQTPPSVLPPATAASSSPPLQPRRRPRRATRTLPVVTPTPIVSTEGPQDLRVRLRSPIEQPPKEPPEIKRASWPPPPPPVTVLVPYPVVVPVPLPLPLPIPIPVPEDMFRNATACRSTMTAASNTPTESVNADSDKQTAGRRVLRARKRPAAKEPPRTIVPA